MYKFQLMRISAVKLSALLAILVLALQIMPVRAQESVEEPEKVADRVQKTDFVLGISWMPGLCEKLDKTPECIRQSATSLDARQFSLAGMWRIRKTYCGVDAALQAQDRKRDWLAMPALVLAADVELQLKDAMPGVVSGYERHQWIKYGTCSGLLADGYYARSLRLLAEVNASEVGRLFAARLGQDVTEAEVKAAFDTAFGPGAGNRVRMRCAKDGSRRVVTGLTIGLGAAGEGVSDLATLIAAAGETKFGCRQGVIDQAGLQ